MSRFVSRGQVGANPRLPLKGTLDTPAEYFCGIAHAQAVAAGLLDRGEKARTVPDGSERAKRRTGS